MKAEFKVDDQYPELDNFSKSIKHKSFISEVNQKCINKQTIQTDKKTDTELSNNYVVIDGEYPKVPMELTSYFSITIMSQVVEYIKNNLSYTLQTDKELANNYFQMISSSILKIKDTNGIVQEANSKLLYALIESRLNETIQKSYAPQ